MTGSELALNSTLINSGMLTMSVYPSQSQLEEANDQEFDDLTKADMLFTQSHPGQITLMTLSGLTLLCLILALTNIFLILRKYQRINEIEVLTFKESLVTEQDGKEYVDANEDLGTVNTAEDQRSIKKVGICKKPALLFFYLFSFLTLGLSFYYYIRFLDTFYDCQMLAIVRNCINFLMPCIGYSQLQNCIAFIVRVEQKQQVNLSKRRSLGTIEKVCSGLVLLLILMQLILAVVTIISHIQEDANNIECSGDQKYGMQVLSSHIVLLVAMGTAFGFIVRIRWFSYDYSHLNITPILVVLSAFIVSFLIKGAYIGTFEWVIDQELSGNFTRIAFIYFIAHFLGQLLPLFIIFLIQFCKYRQNLASLNEAHRDQLLRSQGKVFEVDEYNIDIEDDEMAQSMRNQSDFGDTSKGSPVKKRAIQLSVTNSANVSPNSSARSALLQNTKLNQDGGTRGGRIARKDAPINLSQQYLGGTDQLNTSKQSDNSKVAYSQQHLDPNYVGLFQSHLNTSQITLVSPSTTREVPQYDNQSESTLIFPCQSQTIIHSLNDPRESLIESNYSMQIGIGSEFQMKTTNTSIKLQMDTKSTN